MQKEEEEGLKGWEQGREMSEKKGEIWKKEMQIRA